ncbi:MAG: hypothetical protein AVO33_08680 [delta proteobacterium ML8_F1]|nr:MAG: hypothetical protein AVO33_08680 [delta proteobacterium ML8_F1]
MIRKIIHVDVDAFYAAVEERDNPSLKGNPVIVGGSSDRGVVTTCNYEARKFGIHSAMPLFQARRLCPDGIYLEGRRERYVEVSSEIFKVLGTFTDQIEKVSIDEAYLDITGLYQSPRVVAKAVKRAVKKETGLTVSVGISYNKFLAKLGSDWNKPDGLKEIRESDIPGILKPLDIRKIHGLGEKSTGRLYSIGIHTVEDLLAYDLPTLESFLGSGGKEIYERIRGIDRREVISSHERKSLGSEATLAENVRARDLILRIATGHLKETSRELGEKGLTAKTLTLKIKYDDFTQTTRSKSIPEAADEFRIFLPLLEDLVRQVPLEKSVRLIGVSFSGLLTNRHRQLVFEDCLWPQE